MAGRKCLKFRETLAVWFGSTPRERYRGLEVRSKVATHESVTLTLYALSGEGTPNMSEDIKPEPKKSEALDEATLDQVSGGSHVKEEFRVAQHKDVLKR
jgi:hypothetical protein